MLCWVQAVGLEPTSRHLPLQPIKSSRWGLEEPWKQDTMWHKGYCGGKDETKSAHCHLLHWTSSTCGSATAENESGQFQPNFLSSPSLLWYSAYKDLPHTLPIRLLQAKGPAGRSVMLHTRCLYLQLLWNICDIESIE